MLKWRFLYFILLLTCIHAFGQEASIKLGPEEVGINQYYTITYSINDGRLTSYSGFPDIPGFTKRGTSQSTQTQYINGVMSQTQSVTMSYKPSKEGEFTIPEFTVTINGEVLKSEGGKVRVSEAVQRRDPFRNLFDDPFNPGRDNQPAEFMEVEDKAFLAVSTNKNEVYVGEGVTADLSFYVADDNQAVLNFYELGKQLSEILKKLKPENCWEENFKIENIQGVKTQINGKNFTQYKIYEGTFFPLNDEDVVFPSVGLEMIKYKIAKRRSFFGNNRQEDFKTYYSREKNIKVKPLPDHPLKKLVAVGDYKLTETLDKESVSTGESFLYNFTIYGQGNIAYLKGPEIPETSDFDIYDPEVKQNINRKNRKITGTKSFNYSIVPNEPGAQYLGNYFKWIFFNTDKEDYDTLRSRYHIAVNGESLKNESIQASDLGSFYDGLLEQNNSLRYSTSTNWTQIFINLFIIVSLILAVIFVFKN